MVRPLNLLYFIYYRRGGGHHEHEGQNTLGNLVSLEIGWMVEQRARYQEEEGCTLAYISEVQCFHSKISKITAP